MTNDRVSVIIPIFNSMKSLRQCLDSVEAAVRQYGNAELILVDNGSTDGSYETIESGFAGRAKIFRIPQVTISALRNHGAQAAQGDYLSFIDSDCVIPGDYFHRAMAVFKSVPTDAAGCEYELPPSPSWIEETWNNLHWLRDGFVSYLYGGNFLIKKSVFQEVGGFDESLVTGEDAELALRLVTRGFKIYRAQDISAVHLGNPKSISTFFRKQVWHGLGMFGTFPRDPWDKPVLMTFVHLGLSLLAVLNLFLTPASIALRVVLFALLSSFVPFVTAVYRFAQVGKPYRPVRSTLLYYLYYMARIYAWLLILVRGGKRLNRAGRSIRSAHQ